jgi:hypothetical protein
MPAVAASSHRPRRETTEEAWLTAGSMANLLFQKVLSCALDPVSMAVVQGPKESFMAVDRFAVCEA